MPTDPQHEVHAAYAAFVNSSDGKLILADLTTFAQQIEDPMVQAGAARMFFRILRSAQRGKEATPVRSVRGRASTNMGQAEGE